jgi:elongation factor G
LNLFRVYQGVLRSDSTVYNANKEIEERIGQVLVLIGKNQEPVEELWPGDIGAVAKLQATGTGDTLTIKANPQKLAGIEFPQPSLPVSIVPKSKGDEDKLSNALNRLMEEDTTLRLKKNTETKQTILTGMGEMHLDITVERLQRKFGVAVGLEAPIVPYRETIRVPVNRIEGKHKKQTGGHGQFGHVYIDLAPLPR